MITFKKIEIVGFGSILGPLTYTLDRPGINLILGDNGVGKTTILNALSWCLYGKGIKKGATIFRWPHLLTPDYPGVCVRVEYLKDGSKREVIHCLDYKGKIYGAKGANRLIIVVDGTPLTQLKDKNLAKQWVINDLVSFELFKNAILFGGQRVKRLVEEDGPTRSKILEEVFEADYISQAKIKIDQKLRDSKAEFDGLTNSLEGLRIAIGHARDKFKYTKETIASFDQEKQSEINDLTRRIKNLKSNALVAEDVKEADQRVAILRDKLKIKKSKLKKLTLNLTDPQSRELQLNLQINTLTDEYDALRDDIKNLGKSIDRSVCQYCGSKLESDKVIKQKQEYERKKAKLPGIKSKIQELQEEYASVQKDVVKFKKRKKIVDKVYYKIEQLEQRISMLEGARVKRSIYLKELSNLEDKLTKAKAKKCTLKLNPIRSEIKQLKAKISDLKPKIKTLTKQRAIWEWLIRDPLSNNGLKAFIFEAMLKETNRRLREYSSVIGFNIRMSINMGSSRKDLQITADRGGDDIPHTDLSAGESQLQDVCIALAIHDTVSTEKEFNLMFMDEVFDLLSPGNVEKVASILQKKGQHKSIHIITHNKFLPQGSYLTEIRKDNEGSTYIHSKYSSP